MYRNRLHLEQERQIRHLRRLDELATSIAEFGSTDDLLERIADTAFEISDSSACTLWWCNDDGELEPRFQRGLSERVPLERALLAEPPPRTELARQRRTPGRGDS